MRNWIADQEHCRVALAGDILNCATKSSKSDVYGECMNVDDAWHYACSLLEPIKGKILGSVWGNHEARIYKDTGLDVARVIANSLGVDYAKEGMLLDVKFSPYGEGDARTKGKINYTCYITHGTGGGRKPGSKIEAVCKLRDIVMADIYICGHVHGMGAWKDNYYVPNTRARKIEEVTQLFALSSAYLDWGGYSEDLSLRPSKLGTCRIRLDGKRKDFHCSI